MFGIVALLAQQFPPVEQARQDGLLCSGGDLRPERLLAAYSRGIFPWYGPGLPILWWSPDPRCVMPLEAFHVPSRSARALRAHAFTLTHNAAFDRVIRACAAPRHGESGTWIVPAMINAYERLHRLGYAHSIESWDSQGRLVGGLYGVALGRAFFGESMFHTVSEASRAALVGLVSLLRMRHTLLLDCQQATPHMLRMGGQLLPRTLFLKQLRAALRLPTTPKSTEAEAISHEPTAEDQKEDIWQPWACRYVWSPEGWSRQ